MLIGDRHDDCLFVVDVTLVHGTGVRPFFVRHFVWVFSADVVHGGRREAEPRRPGFHLLELRLHPLRRIVRSVSRRRGTLLSLGRRGGGVRVEGLALEQPAKVPAGTTASCFRARVRRAALRILPIFPRETPPGFAPKVNPVSRQRILDHLPGPYHIRDGAAYDDRGPVAFRIHRCFRDVLDVLDVRTLGPDDQAVVTACVDEPLRRMSRVHVQLSRGGSSDSMRMRSPPVRESSGRAEPRADASAAIGTPRTISASLWARRAAVPRHPAVPRSRSNRRRSVEIAPVPRVAAWRPVVRREVIAAVGGSPFPAGVVSVGKVASSGTRRDGSPVPRRRRARTSFDAAPPIRSISRHLPRRPSKLPRR